MPEHTYTLLIVPGNYRAHLKPHSKVTSREIERERTHRGFCFDWAHSLLVNVKHKSGNLKHRKREKQVARNVSYWSPPRALKQRSLSEGNWPALYVWLLMRLFKIGIVEVDASAIKAQVRHLHYKQTNSVPPNPHPQKKLSGFTLQYYFNIFRKLQIRIPDRGISLVEHRWPDKRWTKGCFSAVQNIQISCLFPCPHGNKFLLFCKKKRHMLYKLPYLASWCSFPE